MLRIVDLTQPLAPGTRGVAATPRFTLARDGWNAADWQLYSHAGTHMDAQLHFAAGPETIDRHTPGRCLGPAWVAELRPCAPRAVLTPADLGPLADRFPAGESLLLRTGWSAHVGDPDYFRNQLPRLGDELAEWCVARRVKMLGVEPLSVADVNDLAEVTRIHRLLLGGGVAIVEGLVNLDRLRAPRVLFGALPLPLVGGDGAPVRAFAIEGLSLDEWHRLEEKSP
jgi:arylformamidase